jgi:UDP-N-acetylglucosamine 2-epimerase (non-hydrolysing)
MVFVVYGTTAEYIKLLPILLDLKKSGRLYSVVLAQHEEQLIKFFDTYPDLPKPDLWLVHGISGRDIDRFYQIPIWFTKVGWAIISNWRAVRRAANRDRRSNIWLVHGDTFTTVFGAIWGRLLRYKVGHVEAGLRSHNIIHPLPEELDRLIVTWLARVHFAPGEIPVKNLTKAKGDVINTVVNTSYDSIQYARATSAQVGIDDLPEVFGIISLHRTEFVANKTVFEQTIRTIAEFSSKVPMVFLKQPVTIGRAKDLGLIGLLEKDFIYVSKLDYFSFIKLLNKSTFVVTDSGGLQEDCSYIGKPCLIVRKATERFEGLAEGITRLSNYDDDILRDFIATKGEKQQGSLNLIARPTEIVMEYLTTKGYLV